ncbi:MAG: GHMP kinase [Pyrobaculum sp.]
MRLKIPHHLTGFWLPHYDKSPVATGSTGAGLLLAEAEIELAGGEVVYNGVVVARRAGVQISSPYPAGYGYAASAVINIAMGVAEVGLSPAAFVTAHMREVLNMTGLGDVLAIYTGGCLVVRIRPGAPGVGEAYPTPCPNVVLITVDLSRYDTRAMLTERAGAIREAGREAVAAFLKDPTFDAFLHHARQFSRRVGFLPRWAELLEGAPGVVGYFAKKGVLAVVAERDSWRDVARLLAGRGAIHVVELRERRVEASR